MPRDNRALTRAARDRARQRNQPYQQAHNEVIAIHKLADENELTWDDAQALYDDPATQILCTTCGWTVGMICPECSKGCGCNNSTCGGWRHREYMTDDELRERAACPECGGDNTSPYTCGCDE